MGIFFAIPQRVWNLRTKIKNVNIYKISEDVLKKKKNLKRKENKKRNIKWKNKNKRKNGKQKK